MVAVGLLMQSAFSNAQTDTTSDKSIRPFQVHIPEEKLVDLKRRILATQWPEKEIVNDESQGVQLTYISFMFVPNIKMLCLSLLRMAGQVLSLNN